MERDVGTEGTLGAGPGRSATQRLLRALHRGLLAAATGLLALLSLLFAGKTRGG